MAYGLRLGSQPNKVRKLRREYEAAQRDRRLDRFFEDVGEDMSDASQRSKVSIAHLFEEFVVDSSGQPCGRELLSEWSNGRNYTGGNQASSLSVLEAGGAVDTSAFANISGQIVYNEILAKYEDEAFVFTAMIPTVSTQFSGEKIAGIERIGDQAQVVAETEDYPLVGVSEDWIRTPETVKRGMILPLTKESIFFDRTGILLERAGEVGYWLGVNKEKRAIDCVIDENTTAHRYQWRDSTYATYQTSASSAPFYDNTTASAALVDWTDIDEANQTLNTITDYNTGEPIVIEAATLIVTKDLEVTASYIRNASEVRIATPGFATTGNPSQTTAQGNLVGQFNIVSTRLLATRLATDTDWFYGNPSAAFRYMENFPLTTEQAPRNSDDEFKRDIAQQWKTSERGAFATIEPRQMSKATA